MGLRPGCAQGKGQRSRDTDTSDYTKIASSTTNMTPVMFVVEEAIRHQT